MLEKSCTQEQKEQGYDIGDLLHNHLVKPKAIEKKEIILEPIRDTYIEELSPIIKDIVSMNPAFLNLIKTFDLVQV